MSARPKQKHESQQRGLHGSRITPARRAAFEILRRVDEEGAFASVLLAVGLDELSAQDRALCYELVLGVLRWQLWLDRLIEYYARRNVQSLDAPVRRALRLGLYQLRFLSRIPARASVNESVNLMRLAKVGSAASFANAVLRRAAREPDYDPAMNISDPHERIAIETSHPVWLIERWSKAFGQEEAESFARANKESPPIAFRLGAVGDDDDRLAILNELRAAGASLEASHIAPDAWRVEGATHSLHELARNGRIYFQDEASQLVAHALDARSGERVLDVCAAPGSKTTHIASRTPDLQLLIAGDLYDHRLRTVLESSRRAGATNLIRAVELDATAELPFPDASFDRVLVDAPCTGTGTLRRNPEIGLRITARDITDLSERQQRILFNASRMVRNGGRLVYSTCSVEREENEEVVAAFLHQNRAFERLKPPVLAPFQSATGAARTWPHREGADGFFICAFERRS